jgi:hypothetical protein
VKFLNQMKFLFFLVRIGRAMYVEVEVKGKKEVTLLMA